jgi:hypothetical protein
MSGHQTQTKAANAPHKRVAGSLSRRLIVVLALAVPLALYGYMMQLVYESGAKSGASFKNAGLFFASIIFTAIMYDCIKTVILLDDRYIIRLSKHCCSLYIGVLVMLLGCLVTSFTYAHSDRFTFAFPAITYLITLVVCIPWIVISLSRVIDTATNAP